MSQKFVEHSVHYLNAFCLIINQQHTFIKINFSLIKIEENSRALEYLAQWGSSSSLESAGTTSSTKDKDKWKQGARKTLLQWVSNALPRYVWIVFFKPNFFLNKIFYLFF